MANSGTGLLVLAVLAVLALNGSKGKGGVATPPGTGTSGSGSTPSGGGPTALPTIGADIGTVHVSQGGRMARMGQGQVIKNPGDQVAVSCYVTMNSNFKGYGVPWPFKIVIRMGHSTVTGWQTVGRFFPAVDSGVRTFDFQSPGGTVVKGVELRPDPRLSTADLSGQSFTVPPDAGKTYDIHIQVLAAVPASDGTPSSSYNAVTEAKDDGAIQISSTPTVGASVAAIGVSQELRLGGLKRTRRSGA